MNRPILPDRWETLAPLLDAALDRAVDERAMFLNEVCRDDPSLLVELEQLVAECDRPAPLLDRGVLESLPSLAEEAPSIVSTTIAERYRIDAEIGAGGMATVYLAHDIRHDRSVAVKVLNPALGARLGPERFLAEIRITAALQHPNILPVYDSGEFEGGLFYVMPFVDGESLRHRLAQGQLTVDAAATIMRDVAKALAYAHGRGVLHRDVKPDNILLSAHGPLVADFGIAEMIGAARGDGEAEGLARGGIAAGTPAYMSPEQAMGSQIDHRADIYALGVVAYEMLAGRAPFEGGDTRQLLAAQVNEAPVPVVEYNASVPPALADLVMRCLAKRPAHRPQSAEDVAQAIEIAPNTTSHAGESLRRGRAGPVIAASILALLLAATFVVIAVFRGRAPTLNPRRIVVAPFTNLTGDSTLDVLGPMISQGITSALEPLDSIEVVSWLAALQSLRSGGPLSEAGRGPRELGAETRAGRVVWGSYTRHGDTLRVHAEIVSASDGRVVDAFDRVAGLISSPNEAIDRVREAVAVGVDAAQARRSIGTLGHIPAIGAYREFWTGWRIVGDDPTALRHYEEAIRRDSAFVLAYYQAATMLWNLSRFPELDSLVRGLEPWRDRFSPVERDLFDDMEAFSRHDWERDLRAMRSLLRRDSTAHYAYLVGFTARATNRPNEGLAALLHYSGQQALQDIPNFWFESARMHHMLGQYDAELARSTAGARRAPVGSEAQMWMLLHRASALAGLGRLTDLRTLVDSAVASWNPSVSGAPSAWYVAIAQELRAHGNSDEARAYVARGLEWNTAHGDGAARANRRAALGDLYMMAHQFNSARTVWQSLVADSVMGARARGNLGIISAFEGDTASSGGILRALASEGAVPHRRGIPQLAAAGVAAALGETADAMKLLNDAHKAGAAFDDRWHAAHSFEPLWNSPAFKEFLRPKG